MTRRVRLLRFCAVGALGTGVQLLALALLDRAWPGHYLIATTAALELTLLHNFYWHARYTWPDRTGNLLSRMLRFHLANGAVSLLGNLLLMRVLVHTCGLPVVAANALAIAACSLLNFTLGDLWAFRINAEPSAAHSSAEPAAATPAPAVSRYGSSSPVHRTSAPLPPG